MKNLNVKKVLLWTIGCVGAAVFAMLAYYGIWIFREQNELNSLNPLTISTLTIFCAVAAMFADKKKKSYE